MPSVTVTQKRPTAPADSVVASVAAAVERLLEEGERFTTLGVQRIADESGIARSTFYRYFPDKSTLLVQAAGVATREQLSVVGEWMEKDAPTREELEDAFEIMVARHREHAPLVRALNEVAGYDEEVAAFWRGRMEESVESLTLFIEAGQAAGMVNPSLEPVTTAELLAWGVERVITQHVLSRPRDEDKDLAVRMSRTVWSTLGLDRDWSA